MLYLALGGAALAAAAIAIVLSNQGPDVVKRPKFEAALLRALPAHPDLYALRRRTVPGTNGCWIGDHISPSNSPGAQQLSIYCENKPNHGGLVADLGNGSAVDDEVAEDTVTCKGYERGVFCLVVHEHVLAQWDAPDESTALAGLAEILRMTAGTA